MVLERIVRNLRGERRPMVRRWLGTWLIASLAAATPACTTVVARESLFSQRAAGGQAPATVALPNEADSLKFAVFGDFGTGEKAQYNLAARMVTVHQSFPFEMVALVGDNIYGSARPADYERKFALPYKPLLDAGVTFYASLGNHDPREQRFYEPFNMKGEFYYSFKAPKQDVRFIALDTTYMEPAQLTWLERTLSAARERWKIVFFHHPLYSSGGTHGSDDRLRQQLEPLFVRHGVSLVLTGHDHLYERVRPQQGITYFVTGSGGKLRPGDAKPGQPFSARVVDNINVFLAAEISGDTLVFNAIGSDGRVVDSGTITLGPVVPYADTRP